MRIRRLPDIMADQIAAGEVIERPASVVKELVENAIDAESTSIQIHFCHQKKMVISVMDDGVGIHPGDLSLAFSRHATSKVKGMEDLYSLKTLGFRGEALSSIASISRIRIESRREEEISGSLLELHGGRYVRDDKISMSPGTRIEVQDLFYNTPARLKHIKQPGTEFTHISSITTRLALAFPGISFTLLHNGREVLRTVGTGRLIDTICCLFNEHLAANLLPLNFSKDYVQVTGYISPPDYSRKTPRQLFFSVNDRCIRSSLLQRTIQESLKGLLPVGRYPFALIRIRINPIHIDVNVHPQKQTIRFSRPETVARTLQGAIEEAVKERQKIPDLFQREEPLPQRIEETPLNLPLSFSQRESKLPGRQRDEMKETLKTEELPTQCLDLMGQLMPLGQLYGTYLLFQGPQALFLMDQHAAHERILYHQFAHIQKKKVKPQSQLLLTPLTLERSWEELAALEDRKEELSTLGFLLESFGPRSLLIRGVPVQLQDLSPEEIQDLFDEIITEKRTEKEINLLCILACHGAVKAGKYMEKREMLSLFQALRQTHNPFQCPHGRPTILQITRRTLEKTFQRS